ncbi:MAG TPA: murein biosynthesis integral membrane protein MurJ, partial [Brevundimonas sp.]|nr:murein biosynthesis integral membrane protein MurJ [Brevundimonas sp.]
LYQLPLGVIGIAMGVALLPTLSKRLRAGDDTGASDTMNRALEISMGLTLPSAIALAVIPDFIITGLYQRGAFTALDAQMASAALTAFAIGLPAFVLIKVLSPGFFARQDTATPMKFAAIGVVVNIVLGLALFFSPVGFVGLAIATATAGWINAALLGFVLHRRGLLVLDARLKSKLVRIALASAIMGAAVAAMALQRDLVTVWTGGSVFLALLAVVAAGGAIYAALALITGAVRIAELRKAMKRG